MARIRTIKPEFPQSESMGNVSRDARLLFVLLWTICDDEGKARGNSRMLASLLFPYDDDAPSMIDSWMIELEEEGCVVRYQSSGSNYLQVCNWLNHQKIDKPSKSKIPDFCESSRILSNPRDVSCVDQGPKDQGVDQGSGPCSAPPATPATPAKESKPTRSTQIHEAFYPDETGVTLADSLSIQFASELEKFRDYHKARGKPMKDWQAAWRTWARNAALFAKERGGNRQPFLTEKQRRDDATTRAIFGSLMPSMTDEKVIEHEPATSIRLD